MIYITQLIFVKEGKEASFLEFEDFAIPLMKKYGGQMVYRVRPTGESFVGGTSERPYEIHIVSFPSEQDLAAFLKDDSRQKFIHLKEESIKSVFMIKGEKV